MESTIHENCPPFRNRKRCDSMRCKARNNCINNKKNKWFQLGNSSIVHSYRVNANCNFNGININIGYYSNIAISKVFLWLKVHRYNTMVCFFLKTRFFFLMKLANWRQNGCDMILLCNIVLVKNNRFDSQSCFCGCILAIYSIFHDNHFVQAFFFFLNIDEHHKNRIWENV